MTEHESAATRPQGPGPRPVLVGIDRTECALAAARWAAERARDRDVPLVLVHAATYVGATGAAGPETDRAKSILARAWSEASRHAPGVTARTELVLGAPEPVLTALSAAAELVVVGLAGSGGIEEMPLKTTAVTLARHAASAIVGVRSWPLTGRPERQVVAGIRDTGTDETVLRAAFEEADRRTAGVLVVHTVSGADPDLATAKRVLAATLADWRRRYPAVPLRVEVEHDNPKQALLRHARHAELVVVGQRPLGVLGRAVFGSTSRWLLRHSQAPVLVTPRSTTVESPAGETAPSAADTPAMTP